MKTMMILLALISSQIGQAQQVEKNGMFVSWYFENDRIYFEVRAPTDGWVMIGINETHSLTGAYLLMSHVIDGQANTVEYKTLSPGNYKPIATLGAEAAVTEIKGFEKEQYTKSQFSLPIKAQNELTKNLEKGMTYIFHIAYSQNDDFNHHSIMRTAVKASL